MANTVIQEIHGPNPQVKEYIESGKWRDGTDVFKNDDMRQGGWEVYAFICNVWPAIRHMLMGPLKEKSIQEE